MPAIFQKIDKIRPAYDMTYRVVLFLCKLLLVVDILITTMAVAGRYIPFIPDPAWSEEVVLTCMSYMAVLSAALAIRRGAHIRMTAFDRYLPPKLVRSLDLMNTLTAVIFIDIAINIPFATFLMKNSISSVPIELEEAARIDGAGVFRIFGTIVLPLLKPMIATIVILNTLNVWNDFMGPLYFIQKREKDVILQEVYRNIGQFSTDWTSLFPMMVLGILPLLVFYIFMQKYIISGVMAGSVKG